MAVFMVELSWWVCFIVVVLLVFCLSVSTSSMTMGSLGDEGWKNWSKSLSEKVGSHGCHPLFKASLAVAFYGTTLESEERKDQRAQPS